MPGLLDETESVLRFVAEGRGPGHRRQSDGQYDPAGKTDRHPEIDRRPHADEVVHAYEIADELGLRRVDQRSRRQNAGAH